jgi:hypothetical protein
MLLGAVLDGILTRVGLALGAKELNPTVDISNLWAAHTAEISVALLLITFNALASTRPEGILFRASSKSTKLAASIFVFVVLWNLSNILLDALF